MARPTIEAVDSATLPELGEFLHRHLDASRSPAQWADGLRSHWAGEPPNHGFVLREAGAIVGAIGAYYAERLIDGRHERLCNITSWCVLDSHRQQSMRLAMAVLGQPGWHFTDFSPTQVVAGTLKFLKFKPLDEREVVTLNLPWLALGGPRIVADDRAIAAQLSGEALRIYEDHRRYPWLRHVLVGRPGAWCHVIYKRRIFKRLPVATVLHASDAALLDAGWRRLAAFWLSRGLVGAQVEHRLLGRSPWPAAIRSGFNAKLYRSDTLSDAQIDYLYSETMALDL